MSVPGVFVLVAVSIVSYMAGCGDDPYKAAAKEVARNLSESSQEFTATLMGSPGGTSGGPQQTTADIDETQQAIADMSAAVDSAFQDLNALVPPPEARSFHPDYLAGLQDYASGLDALSQTLDYADGAFPALTGVLTQEGQAGVWADVAELTARGVNENNVAEAAAVFAEAQSVLENAATLWGAAGPPQAMRSAHDAVLSGLEGLTGTFSDMAGLSAAAADPGSDVDLSPILLLWELALDQWEDLLASVNAWFAGVNEQMGGIATDLEDVQERLDRLSERLDDL